MKLGWIKWAALLWIIAVVTFVSFVFSQNIRFDSSIMTLLPKSEQQPLAQQGIEQTAERFSKRLLILVSAEEEIDAQSKIKELSKKFMQLPDVSSVLWRFEKNYVDVLKEELFPFRFALIDASSEQKLKNENFEFFTLRSLAKIYSPLGAGELDLVQDPFGFYAQLSQQQQIDINIQITNSLLKVTKANIPTYLMIVNLTTQPYSLAIQQSIMGFLEQQTQSLAGTGVSIQSSGMILHASAGANQAKSEISSIGIGSLIGIIAVILIVFRQFKTIFLMLIPMFIGCVGAIAVTALVFGSVHLITLAFGAGLVGVSVDYALHFLAERRYAKAELVLPKIISGLSLGLLSSVLAYSVQAFAPFPGLQQMAVFSVAGLIFSWLTVVLVFPVLTASDDIKPISSANALMLFRNKIPHLRQPHVFASLAILTLISVYIIVIGKPLDDVRLLQTSPAQLLKQEQSIQKQLGTSSSSQFILVKADSLQLCLQKEHELVLRLQTLSKNNTIPTFQALSDRLPSTEQQLANYQLVDALYQHELATLYKKLQLPDYRLSKAQEAYASTSSKVLDANTWLSSQSSEAWRDLLVSDKAGNSATIIRFLGHLDEQAKLAINDVIAYDPELILIDQVDNISGLMKDYRQQISLMMLLAYIVVFMLLIWRYRVHAWRVILPPVLASIFALASIIIIEDGINMFHFLALILVLGIGLDMGIFMAESQENEQTWTAVTLSNFTSILAFGLLAWSQTPVLHHFGITVLIGLILVWLLTPMMRKHIV